MSQVGTSAKKGGNLPQYRSLALVSAGSNTPFGNVDPTETVVSALYTFCAMCGVIRSQSRLFRTPAFPPGSGPEFVNAACALETDVPPEALLKLLHQVEAEHGRERRRRWGPRTLDLDLIAYENQIVPSENTFHEWAGLPMDQQLSVAPKELILPHPRMHERAFVLVPLADVAPDWRHPVFGRTVSEMLKTLPENAVNEVRAI